MTHLATHETFIPGSPPSPNPVGLKPLDWDTEFFGARMGELGLASTTKVPNAGSARTKDMELGLRTRIAEAAERGYAHLIYRVPADDMPSIWAAETGGLKLVDVGIDSTFHFDRVPLPEPLDGITIRPSRDEDVPALRDLAGDAFVVSRYAADPFFSREAVVAFYRQWVTNLHNGLAQAVLVCEIDGVPAGFVACAVNGDEGRIPLIATRVTDRRRGIGRGLVTAALRWFAAAGNTAAHVKTQTANYPALALYQRAGFVVSRAELTFSIAFGPSLADLTQQ